MIGFLKKIKWMQQEEFFILKKFNFSFQGIISYKQHVD
jgi:hypothetical protein